MSTEVKFIFLGDFNCYKPDDILILSPQLRQLVHYPTHGDKTLDLVITDMHTSYHPPQVIQPLLPDDPGAASPSDHLGNLLIPRTVPGVPTSRICKHITVRPLTDSHIAAIGSWIGNFSWDNLSTVICHQSTAG